MLSIRLCQCLIAPHPANLMFDNNPVLGKVSIIGNVLRWPLFFAGLTARRSRKPLWVDSGNADVGKVADCPNPAGKSVQQARLLEQGEVCCWPAHALTD